MKLKLILGITLLGLTYSMQLYAQTNTKKDIKLKDVGVPAPTNNPNRVSGPLDPVPPPRTTIKQNVDNHYQQSQSKPHVTPVFKDAETHPNDHSIGVGVSTPIDGGGVKPTLPAKASRQ